MASPARSSWQAPAAHLPLVLAGAVAVDADLGGIGAVRRDVGAGAHRARRARTTGRRSRRRWRSRRPGRRCPTCTRLLPEQNAPRHLLAARVADADVARRAVRVDGAAAEALAAVAGVRGAGDARRGATQSRSRCRWTRGCICCSRSARARRRCRAGIGGSRPRRRTCRRCRRSTRAGSTQHVARVVVAVRRPAVHGPSDDGSAQLRQAPVQAWSQQTPSTQWLLAQSPAAAQGWPFDFLPQLPLLADVARGAVVVARAAVDAGAVGAPVGAQFCIPGGRQVPSPLQVPAVMRRSPAARRRACRRSRPRSARSRRCRRRRRSCRRSPAPGRRRCRADRGCRCRSASRSPRGPAGCS